MRRNRILVAFLIGLSALGVVTKLFTEEIFLRDEPTVAMRLRTRPSMENFSTSDTLEAPGRVVLLQDENDYPGSGVYRGLVGWGWIVLLLLTTGYIIQSRPKDRTGPDRRSTENKN